MVEVTVELVLFAALLVHGIGHAGALGALAWMAYRPGTTGNWRPAKSWMLPSLSARLSTAIASVLWILSLVGFVVVALAFWGLLDMGESWRPIAIGSAIVSSAGILLFFRTWPMPNTVAALGMNLVAVVMALAWV